MEEFNCDVSCPNCGTENTETFAFNFMEADQAGCYSRWHNFFCIDCEKSYWAKARVSFEVEVYDTSLKKPKELKKVRGE